ncbi:Ig-like domain-containing protein, partial [Bacillus cereus]
AYVKLQREGGGVERTVFLTYNAVSQRYEGTYNVPSDAGNGRWEVFFVYANDKAGNMYYTLTAGNSGLYQSFNIVKDTTAPTAPTVSEVTDQSTSVTGTAEVKSNVSVKAGTKVLGTAQAGTDGKFSVGILKQAAGTKLTVTATDGAGNSSKVTEVIVKDVTAPTRPTVSEVTDQSTNMTGVAEANSLVYVKVGSTIIGRGKTDVAGKFSITIPVQKAGTRIG